MGITWAKATVELRPQADLALPFAQVSGRLKDFGWRQAQPPRWQFSSWAPTGNQDAACQALRKPGRLLQNVKDLKAVDPGAKRHHCPAQGLGRVLAVAYKGQVGKPGLKECKSLGLGQKRQRISGGKAIHCPVEKELDGLSMWSQIAGKITSREMAKSEQNVVLYMVSRNDHKQISSLNQRLVNCLLRAIEMQAGDDVQLDQTRRRGKKHGDLGVVSGVLDCLELWRSFNSASLDEKRGCLPHSAFPKPY